MKTKELRIDMKTKELRIGNWIKINGELKQVDSLLGEEIHCEPVELDEDWLLGFFGFEKEENEGYEDFMYSKGIFTLFRSKDFPQDYFTYPLLMRYGNPNEYKSGVCIKHVHRLQNLYFDLNNEEI